MTAADKFGIAFSVGVTVAFVAFAMAITASHNVATPVTPVPPTPAPPAPTPAPEETPTAPVEETPEETPSDNETTTTPTEETPEEESPDETYPVDISISEGASSPGCETDGTCYVESDITVGIGTTVTWTNDDTAAHTVTSGTPTDGPDEAFDSGIITAGSTFENTFEEAGDYDYFCIVHPWMTGKVTVE